MRFNSFKYSGISCSLDGSEDDMFRDYEDLEIEYEEGSDQQDEYRISSSS